MEVESEVDQIEEQIWHYHDALESARDAWLRGNLSGEANTRLLGLSTPASFGLPLFTDDQQARCAQQQELQIGRRLHQRNVTMDRIHLGAVVVDWTVTGASLLLGLGILASIGRKGGRWVVVKTLAGVGAGYLADHAAEAGLRAAAPASKPSAAPVWPRP